MATRIALVAAALVATAEAHAGLFIPTARNANDRDLPGFAGGGAPSPRATQCTCANGVASKLGAPCDQGLRANGGGQPCLWWSQGCSIGCAQLAPHQSWRQPFVAAALLLRCSTMQRLHRALYPMHCVEALSLPCALSSRTAEQN